MSKPRFIPSIPVSQIRNRGERIVAEALEQQLGSEWTVFHSYSFLRLSDRTQPKASGAGSSYKQHLLEGEADFVILHPKKGLLLLEVKGGDIEFDPASGRWRQNGDDLKDPFAQARDNLHALVNQLEERRVPKPTHGYAVMFPTCVFTGSLPAGAHPKIAFSSKDRSDLGPKIVAALGEWARRHGDFLRPDQYRQLLQALQSTFDIRPSLLSQVDHDEEVFIQLTREQARALQGIYSNERVRVEGTAGSGKTLLALERAKKFAEEGKRVLFLCYNRNLADWLRRETDTLAGLEVYHFHALCAERCGRAKIEFSPPASDSPEAGTFWTERAPELLMDAIDTLPERFDAIVVDEAQDFHEDWWLPIEALNRRHDGPLYIFFDREQNLYGREFRPVKTQVCYQLSHNCRSTRRLASTCSEILNTEIPPHELCPEGSRPRLVRLVQPELMLEEVKQVVQKWLKEEGFKPSRIAILSPFRKERSALNLDKLAGYPLSDSVADWRANRCIWFSTIKGFKGLEADLVIVVDLVDFADQVFEKNDLFVACSRARHRLLLFTSSQQIIQILGSTVDGG